MLMPAEAAVVAVEVVAGAAARAEGALGPEVGRDPAVAPGQAVVLGPEAAVGPAEGLARPRLASLAGDEWVAAGALAAALVPISAAGLEAESIGRISAGGLAADGLMLVDPAALTVVLESAIDLVADESISGAVPESATARAADAPISDDRESPAADPT
jgi:hypothetical protein